MKKIIISIVLVLLVVLYIVINENTNNRLALNNPTFTVEGKEVTLVDGESITDIPDSSSKVITKYFGNEVTGDLDNDGREDKAFLITQNQGGSGTFYYLVAVLNTVDGYVGSHALLIGDRIAPQTTEIDKNIIVVNYADRKAGESFDIQPSEGKSIRAILDKNTMQFGTVEKDFEGEADPSKMTLGMKKWNWISTQYEDGKVVKPIAMDRFALTFNDVKTFSASTDCNGVGGEYSVTGSNIKFERMMSTLMYCEGSQEQEFSKMIAEASAYKFTSKGELIFELKASKGSMTFR